MCISRAHPLPLLSQLSATSLNVGESVTTVHYGCDGPDKYTSPFEHMAHVL